MAFDPNDPLGTDIGGVTDIDANLTMVSGKRCVAEAVARRWIEEPGGLWYDQDYGAGLMRYLNGSDRDIGTLPSRLEIEARKDERVDDCQVSVDLVGDVLSVSGRLYVATGPFEFVFALSATSSVLEVFDT